MTKPGSQSYYHGCDAGDPDTASVIVTYSEASEDHVFPASITLAGKCLMCDARPVVLRAVTTEELAEFGVEMDDAETGCGEEECTVCNGGRHGGGAE